MVLDNTPVWVAECSSDGPDYDFHQKIVFGVFTDKKMTKACLLYQAMDIVSLSMNEQYPDIPKKELKRYLNITMEKISDQIDLIGEAEAALAGENRYDRDDVPMSAYWDEEAIERFATRMRSQGIKRDPMGEKVYEALLSISAAAYSDMLRMDDPDEDVFGLVRQMIELLPDWTKEKELLSHAYILYSALDDPMALAKVYKRILFGDAGTI